MHLFMRWFLIAIVLGTLGVPVLAQDATEEATMAEVEPWVCPPGFEGQTLNVYNWSTYIAEDTVDNFKAACGLEAVNYDVYENNESLLARMRAGNPGYDIIVPTDVFVATLIAEGLVEPINLDNIPNFANVGATFQNPPYDPDNQYSIPYLWGTVGVGYNRTKVGEDITSWEQVWNYPNRTVEWLDDPRAMLGTALTILGYDASTSNPDEVAQARDYLIANGTNVQAIAQDDGQAHLLAGNADIVIEYNGDIFQIIDECECEDFAYVIPIEGAQLWVDNMVIPAGASNHALAEVFMDYILHPQVNADIANYVAYATANQAAIDLGLVDEELLTNPGIYPDEETIARLFFNRDNPEGEQYFNDAWDEIKVLVG